MKKLIKKNPFNYWMLIQTTTIIIATIMAAELNSFFYNQILSQNPNYHPIDELGIIAPMIVIMVMVSYVLAKKLFKYMNTITEGIQAVSSGNFDQKLDLKKAGPYEQVYKDFNKMTAELRNTTTLRNDFINKFSHEFKTPITSINGFSELLLHQNVSETDQQKYLEIIAQESQRLAQLSQTVMILTALESQEIMVDKTWYDLEEQLKQATILVVPQLSKKSLQLDIAVVPMKYYGNKEMIQHIWINLLNNAIKFTPDHGTIKITSSAGQEEAIIQISDSGIGMEKEATTKIFDKFYQADKSGKEEGLGLGLSIVKRVVKLAGGEISVESKLGHGTTFTIKLRDVKTNL